MKKIKKQNPKMIGSKPRKLKWHRSKDSNGMPFASCEVDISSVCDYYVVAEVTHLQGNQYSVYVNAPGDISAAIAIFGFEKAIERAEKKILAQIAKSIKQLSRWV